MLLSKKHCRSSSSDETFESHAVEEFVEDVSLDILREKLLLKEEVVSILYYKDWLHDYNYVLDTYNFVFTRLGKQVSCFCTHYNLCLRRFYLNNYYLFEKLTIS